MYILFSLKSIILSRYCELLVPSDDAECILNFKFKNTKLILDGFSMVALV